MSPSRLVTDQTAESVRIHKQIQPHLNRTPLLLSRLYQTGSSEQTKPTRLYFKTENFQYTGSFKLRGALSKLSTLNTDSPVITASSGNHGIACAFAAKTTGHGLTVVLPENVVKEKHDQIAALGATIILNPGDAERAEQHALLLAEQQGMNYISPYNDTAVIAGQGTIALELLEQCPDIDNVFVSMGGGGLISGIGCVLKARSPNTKIIGVSATASAALAASMKAGHIVETNHTDTLADGCAGGVHPDTITLQLAMQVVDEVVHCSEAQISNAIRSLAWDEQMIVEGAAAMALAAFQADPAAYEGKNNVVLLCGANFDQTKIADIISAA